MLPFFLGLSQTWTRNQTLDPGPQTHDVFCVGCFLMGAVNTQYVSAGPGSVESCSTGLGSGGSCSTGPGSGGSCSTGPGFGGGCSTGPGSGGSCSTGPGGGCSTGPGSGESCSTGLSSGGKLQRWTWLWAKAAAAAQALEAAAAWDLAVETAAPQEGQESAGLPTGQVPARMPVAESEDPP
ncbi:uncharacterized protein V6R79_026004 [Siganus canaliculatus]